MSSVNLVERLGVSYAEIGKFEQAIGYLEQIKPINMNSDVKFELAFTYFNLKEYQKAIKAFEDLRDSDPQYSSLYPYLADSFVNLKRVDEALKAIQEGISIDQFNEKIWQKAGQIALMANEDDLALKYLKKGHEIAPDDMEILTLLSDWYVSHERYSDNLTLLEGVFEEHVVDAHLAYNLALSYQNTGDTKKLPRITNWRPMNCRIILNFSSGQHYSTGKPANPMRNANTLRSIWTLFQEILKWKQCGTSSNKLKY